MTVLIVFLSATGVALAGALLSRRPLRRAVPLALRAGLATMFAVTGVTHFVVLRDDLVAMVPPGLPAPELLVTVTGVLELAAAVGLLVTPTAAWAAGGLVLLLLAVFPANVHAAASGATLAGEPATALGPRAAMQVLYVAAACVVVVAYRRSAVRPGELTRAVRSVSLALPRADGPAADRPVGVVVVTRLRLRSPASVPGFLRASLALRRALRTAPGAVWLDLSAQPLARTFTTASAWTDEVAMRRYVRSPRHARAMRRYGPALEASQVRVLTPPRDGSAWGATERLLRTGAAVGGGGPEAGPSGVIGP